MSKIRHRVKEIPIRDFVDLQDVMMEHDIPMVTSINRVMIELLEYYDKRGFDEVYIVLNQLVAPASYYANGVLWGNLISPRLDIPHVRSYINQKESQLIIYAGHNKIEPNFYKRIQLELQTKSVLVKSLPSVPKAYQANPYILVTRLKKKQIYIKVDITNTSLIITKRAKPRK